MAANTNHVCFKQPTEQSFVWKYFELNNFLDFIIHRELHLSRIDQFEDKFEGSLGLMNYDLSVLNKELAGMSSLGKKARLLSNDEILKLIKENMYVSCWHLNPKESMAMWKIYSKSKNTVAIKCNYASLVNALPNNCYIGKVDYYDFHSDTIDLSNLFTPVMYKRKEYEYEQEVRIIRSLVGDNKENKTFYKVSVLPETIIENIYISPGCDKNFKGILSNILNKYNYNIPIMQSDLLNKPILQFSALTDKIGQEI